MFPSQHDLVETMNRFQWLSSNTIRLINREGVEKIIDLYNNQDEIEYNIIPMFNDSELTEKKRHYFNNREPLQVKQVLERLKRKYQCYKSAYYL